MRKDWIPSGIAIAFFLLVGLAANAQPLMRSVPGGSNGVAASQITNTTAAVAAVSTTITPTVPSRRLVIKTDPTSAVVYVDLTNGTATSADFRIEPGGSLTYEGEPIAAFTYLGASAAGTISVLAY